MTKKFTAAQKEKMHKEFDKEVEEFLEAQEAVINPPVLLQQIMAMTRPQGAPQVGLPPMRGAVEVPR